LNAVYRSVDNIVSTALLYQAITILRKSDRRYLIKMWKTVEKDDNENNQTIKILHIDRILPLYQIIRKYI